MGLIGNIGNVFKNIVSQVAPAAIKAIAGPATSLLNGVVGDLFTKGGAALNKLAGGLPGPFAGLAQKLLGATLPKLQQMATGGLDGLIQKLASSITERFAPDAGNLNLPSTQAPDRASQLQNNNPVSTNQGAATGTAAGVDSSNPAPSGSDLPPAPLTGKDAEDIGKQNDFNAKMQSYQARLSAMNRYWEMMSNIYKAHDSTARAITSNLR